MNTLSKVLANTEEMEREAEAFIDALPAETNSATLITFSGELGAGKTTFIQFVAKALGVEDTVNSPTFVIEKIYTIPGNTKFARLVHIDAYRLASAGDLTVLGFGEVMSHTGTLILLEWPEKVPGIEGEAAIRITLEVLADNTRKITYA